MRVSENKFRMNTQFCLKLTSQRELLSFKHHQKGYGFFCSASPPGLSAASNLSRNGKCLGGISLFSSNAGVKNTWNCPSTTYTFMGWCLIAYRNIFTLVTKSCLLDKCLTKGSRLPLKNSNEQLGFLKFVVY